MIDRRPYFQLGNVALAAVLGAALVGIAGSVWLSWQPCGIDGCDDAPRSERLARSSGPAIARASTDESPAAQAADRGAAARRRRDGLPLLAPAAPASSPAIDAGDASGAADAPQPHANVSGGGEPRDAAEVVEADAMPSDASASAAAANAAIDDPTPDAASRNADAAVAIAAIEPANEPSDAEGGGEQRPLLVTRDAGVGPGAPATVAPPEPTDLDAAIPLALASDVPHVESDDADVESGDARVADADADGGEPARTESDGAGAGGDGARVEADAAHATAGGALTETGRAATEDDAAVAAAPLEPALVADGASDAAPAVSPPSPELAAPTATGAAVADAASLTATQLASAKPPPLPAPEAPDAASLLEAPPAIPSEPGDLSGWWDLSHAIDTTTYLPYLGLRMGYRVRLRQEGEKLVGTGERWSENGRVLGSAERTPISLEGMIVGRSVTLRFTEQGSGGKSGGVINWQLAGDGAQADGIFASSAARSSGLSKAKRIRSQ